MDPQSAILPQATVNREATEVYGQGPTIVRIGNGGAGQTGVIGALANAYLFEHAPNGSITWTYNLSRNTHLALLYGLVDITLTYDRALEDIAAGEGWSTTVSCAFHDHFVLAGPVTDPLDLKSVDDIDDALLKVAEAGEAGKIRWHSRSDNSATMVKEHHLWSRIGKQPWTRDADEGWYRKNLNSPRDALIEADKAGAYHITDRSTILRQTARGLISNTTVFFEPASADDVLLNSAYACKASQASSPELAEETERFLRWLIGNGGQEVVKTFGEEEAGLPFFAPVDDGYCRRMLRRGRPHDGRWVYE